tara:strand:+ start:637 stop:1083 length:447 start_codon:yes stop_codon:yes gene_type:complete
MPITKSVTFNKPSKVWKGTNKNPDNAPKTRKRTKSYEPCANFGGKVVCNLGKKKDKPPMKKSSGKNGLGGSKSSSSSSSSSSPTASPTLSDQEIYDKFKYYSVPKLNLILVELGLRKKDLPSINSGGVKRAKILKIYKNNKSKLKAKA